MRRLRLIWIGLLSFLLPPLGLVQSGASWAMVALFTALFLAESVILTFAPPNSVQALAALLSASLASHTVAAVLAIRAARHAPFPLPWMRRWYALPVWFALLYVAMPDSWVEGGYEVYIVPSASMEPTLRVGERFFAHAPNPDAGFHRGEVIVFRTGPGEGVDYVKRVVGLAGDVVQMRAGILHINGAPVPREALGPQAGGTATLYRETLPGGAAHEILEQTDDGYSDNTPEFHVPGGHLFMMGDNRDNSLDSRATVGFVPVARVTARARFILWGPDRSRVGTRLD